MTLEEIAKDEKTAQDFIDFVMETPELDDAEDDLDTCPTCMGEGTSWDGLVECLDCGGTGH